MKTAKLVIGIVSLVLSLVIIFQSCAAGIGNAIADNGEVSGSAGLFVAICMIVSGIVGIATRSKKTGGFVAGGFFVFGGIIGMTNYGSFSDLMIWSVLCFIFAVVFILGSILQKEEKVKEE